MHGTIRLSALLMACAAVGWARHGMGAEAEPAQGSVKREHFAFAGDIDYLDGPRLEALGTGKGMLPTNDRDGNLYLVCKYSTCRIRCVRADGQVETIAGDDRWPGNLKLEEGPAAYFPNRFFMPQAGDYSKPGALLAVFGCPLKGEDQGRIYFFWPGESPYKIFKNKDKEGRWWFKRMGAPGKAKPPTTVGQSAKLDETDLTDAQIGKGFIVWQGNVYAFDEPKGEMTCAFTLADYESKVESIVGNWPGKRPDRGLGAPEHVARADDGSVYLIYFWKTYPSGHVFRMSADRKEFQRVVADRTGTMKGQNIDGPGEATTWHCGPADITAAGNVLFLHAIDSVAVRRWMGGRVSTLCYDGQWRESPGARGRETGPVFGKHHQPGREGVNYIYITYPGEENGSDVRVYRFGPVDFSKPTVGPLVQGQGGQQ